VAKCWLPAKRESIADGLRKISNVLEMLLEPVLPGTGSKRDGL
jgi:hypothetical protein